MDYEAMKRGGKVKAKAKGKKKAMRKTGGVSQVQTVKVNINTGRGRKGKAKGEAKKKEPVTQPAFNMFGYRLAPSMPIMGGSVTPQQDTSKLDLVLSKIAEQQKETQRQQKMMEDIRDTRQPTGQPATSMIFESLRPPSPDLYMMGPTSASPEEPEEEPFTAAAAPEPEPEKPRRRRFVVPMGGPEDVPLSVKGIIESAFSGTPARKSKEEVTIAGEVVKDKRKLTNEQRRDLGLSPVGRPPTKKGKSESK
jgi:hypothetical protein